MVHDKADITRMALLIATYRCYLHHRVDNLGLAYDINEPWFTNQDNALVDGNSDVAFLALSPFTSLNLGEDKHFTDTYLTSLVSIRKNGILATLSGLV